MKKFHKKLFTDAVVQSCSAKKLLLKISHDSQESTCVEVPF